LPELVLEAFGNHGDVGFCARIGSRFISRRSRRLSSTGGSHKRGQKQQAQNDKQMFGFHYKSPLL
jgi:hypothetical protein